jgi:nucleotide-binding universal stress UspA family protein
MEAFEIKNVVVALDFSKYSKLVLRQAQILSKKFKAKLHIIYVAEDVPLTAAPELYSASFRYPAADKDRLKSQLLLFYKIKESDELSVSVKTGAVTRTILREAESKTSPLLVIGSHGKPVFSKFILGSHAEEISLSASVPVWVHRGSKIRHFKHMLLPVDFTDVTQKLVNIFEAAHAKYKIVVNFIYIRPQPVPMFDYGAYAASLKVFRSVTQKLARVFSIKNHGLKLKVVSGDVVPEIVSRAKNYDLVIMSPHNKSGIFRRMGRVTSKVIQLSPVPVLIVKP